MSDLVIDYDVHLHAGRVWRCYLQLPCTTSKYIYVTVEVIAPNKNLAQYIASTIYPEFTTLSIEDEPIKPGTSENISASTT